MSVGTSTTEAVIGDELAALVPNRVIDVLDVRPYAYRTSHWLADVSLTFADGGSERLIMKDLGRASLSVEAQDVKSGALLEPVREIDVYRDVLDGSDLGTAGFFGAVVRPDDDRYWLFIEFLTGVELYQVGTRAVWCDAAVQLADLHDRLRDATTASLHSWDPAGADRWIDRAVSFTDDVNVKRLRPRYGELVERLEAMPRGFLHGELYASNVIVDLARERFSPIDWETAGIGPQMLDLAALTAGTWSDGDRNVIALAYFDVRADGPSTDAFLADLDACRLYLALQWLGWARDWNPPAETAYDWAADVAVLGERLGLL